MKKVILIALLFIGSIQFAQSQIHFGIKGGVNYNSKSISNVSSDILSGAKSKTGFHAGIWLRGKIPILGLFIQPELVYTQLSNEVVYLPKSANPSTTSYEFRKIDIPVLLGKKVFGIGRIFAGPSFQYVLDGDFSISDITNVKADGFSVGMQLGAGIDLGKLGLDVRWERAFSDTESSLLNTNTVNFDTRVNQIIVGLSYRF
ncbi:MULTISPECIES: porin family protein [unclassified Tenacibaculum]|uniref:porin family protein n=1 Tax=unclassified Tenacibaculum TaxID=2635139 RepID=UPI001F1BA8C6|nr:MULTISPECIES: porin family protein [unclassified Tenacibaculum]MCF2875830.1 PorT family protein [Tenacibaculum sp. Cn5-1]MCF2935905.1 PorT family protein [Tenacibaculum sp. Cn5-34]MCG7512466.1 PorT family protein [Tenacibaculum sp. Cn5-46]